MCNTSSLQVFLPPSEQSKATWHVFHILISFLGNDQTQGYGISVFHKWLTNLEDKNHSDVLYFYDFIHASFNPVVPFPIPLGKLGICWSWIQILLPGEQDFVIIRLSSVHLLSWHTWKYIWGLCNTNPESLWYSKNIKNKELMAMLEATGNFFKWKDSALLSYKYAGKGVLYFLETYFVKT